MDSKNYYFHKNLLLSYPFYTAFKLSWCSFELGASLIERFFVVCSWKSRKSYFTRWGAALFSIRQSINSINLNPLILLNLILFLLSLLRGVTQSNNLFTVSKFIKYYEIHTASSGSELESVNNKKEGKQQENKTLYKIKMNLISKDPWRRMK